MNEVIQWGPFIIRTEWIALLMSGLLGYIGLKYRLKKISNDQPVIHSTITNMLFAAVMIWKLSYALFNPISVINNPMTLLYFTGGVRGIGLAIIFSIVYLLLQAKKQKKSVWAYMDILAVGYLAFMSTSYICHSLLVPWGQLLILTYIQFVLHVVSLVWFLLKINPAGSREDMLVFVQWYSLIQIFIGFFEEDRSYFIFGFSLQQIIYLLITIWTVANSMLEKNLLILNARLAEILIKTFYLN